MTRPHGVPNRPPNPRRPVAFLTVEECARELRVSKMTIFRAIHRYELPAIRVGKQFRVNAAAFSEYIRGAVIWSEDEDEI